MTPEQCYNINTVSPSRYCMRFTIFAKLQVDNGICVIIESTTTFSNMAFGFVLNWGMF